MLLLHLADLHLGWEPSGWPPDRAGERRRRRDALLPRAVAVALERDVDAVVIAGDLFETFDPPAPLVEFALRELRRLTEAGVALVTLPGNHDEITYAASLYRRRADDWPGLLISNPWPAHVGTLELGGTALHLYGLAYTGGLTPAGTPLRDFPRLDAAGVHLATFHGTLGLPPGGERSLPLDADALGAAGYDYIALGHVHRPLRREFPAGPAVYSGCNAGKGFDDPGVPFWTLVHLEPGRARVEEVPADIQPVRDDAVDVTPLEDEADLDAAIAALADADAVQRIRLTGALHLPGLQVEALAVRHAERFFHLEVRDHTASVAPELLQRWARERTIRGAFVARMQRALEAAEDDAARARVQRALRYGVAALQGAGLPEAPG